MSRAKYSNTAASVPIWVTAVNDAPASPSKNTFDVMARCPDEEIGRNSVRPCTTDSTITCNHDMAGASVTTTTVPWRPRAADSVHALESGARHRPGAGHRVAHRGRHAAFVGDVDVGEPAVGGRDDVLGLRHRPGPPRPVHLDDQLLTLGVEAEAAPVTDPAVPAGVHAHREVFDDELRVAGGGVPRRAVRDAGHGSHCTSDTAVHRGQSPPFQGGDGCLDFGGRCPSPFIRRLPNRELPVATPLKPVRPAD